MNGNRGQFTSSPMFHINTNRKKSRPAEETGAPEQERTPVAARFSVLSIILTIASRSSCKLSFWSGLERRLFRVAARIMFHM